MEEIKDSVANVTTIGAVGAVMVDWSTILTMTLLVTGIVLNIARIIEIRRRKEKQTSLTLDLHTLQIYCKSYP